LSIVCEDFHDGLSLKEAAKKGKEKLSVDTELAHIKAITTDNMAKIATADETHAVTEINDITQEMIAPKTFFGPSLKPSKFATYKGMLRKLANCEESVTVGILAGTAGDGEVLRIVDLITGNSTDEILACPEVKERWKVRKYEIMGLAVLHVPDSFDVHSTLKFLSPLKSPLTTLLLLCGKNKCRDFEAFEVDVCSDDPNSAFVAVNLQSVAENKKSGIQCFQGHYSLLGVSYQDTALSLAHNRLLDLMTMANPGWSSSSHGEESCDSTRNYCLHAVPADGLCFFHSVIHAINFTDYLKIPRQESGYAQNQRHVQQEEQLAKKLLQSVLEQCDPTIPDDKKLADDLADACSVPVDAIPMVCAKLKFSVRVTISPEARG